MMNMMHSTTGMTGIGTGMFWLHLHWFFGAFAIVGFILLTVWALKNLTGNKLKSVTMWLLVIGIIGTLVTAPFAAGGFKWMMGTWRGGYGYKTGGMMINSPMMMQMMDMMMGHDEGIEGEEHDEHEEMEEMMRQMMQGTWHDQQGNTRGMMMDNMGNGMMDSTGSPSMMNQ